MDVTFLLSDISVECFCFLLAYCISIAIRAVRHKNIYYGGGHRTMTKQISVTVTTAPGNVKDFTCDITNKREIHDCLASLRMLIRSERKARKIVERNKLIAILGSIIDEKISALTPNSFLPSSGSHSKFSSNDSLSTNYKGGNV